MKTVIRTIGLLLIASLVSSDVPATGPSGTVCESVGGSCKGIPDGTLISFKNNCSRFIQCFQECGCDKECSGGLHFNVKLQVCDWPSKAGCCVSCVEPATGPSGIVCDSPGGSCKNINDGVLIRYENDCSKYIQCSMGCGYERNCPVGTHFNQTLQGCTWPAEAGCDPSYQHLQPSPVPSPGSVVTPDSKPTPSPDTTTKSSSHEISTVVTPDTTKPPRPSIPDSSNTIPIVSPTPSPNPSPSVTSSSSSSTEATPIVDPTRTPKPTQTTSICTSKPSPNPPPEPTPTPNPGAGQSSCSDKEIGSLLPFDGNCSKFIACGDGIRYIMDCGSRLHFNAALEACDLPENAGCDSTFGKPEPNPSCQNQSAGASCLGKDDGKLLPYRGNCTHFVACANGCGFDVACGSGLHFNSNLEVCDYPEDAGCDPTITTTTKATPSSEDNRPGSTPSSKSTSSSCLCPCSCSEE